MTRASSNHSSLCRDPVAGAGADRPLSPSLPLPPSPSLPPSLSFSLSPSLPPSLPLSKQVRARILFTSTSEIYGDPKESPQRETYWGNVNPIGPRCPHHLSHLSLPPSLPLSPYLYYIYI